ncbi:MAG: DUF2185 domain-containing protein [Planctomycetota bacterium]
MSKTWGSWLIGALLIFGLRFVAKNFNESGEDLQRDPYAYGGMSHDELAKVGNDLLERAESLDLQQLRENKQPKQTASTKMNKKFRLDAEEIESLLPPMGYCIATDRITVEGAKIGYFYRESPDGPDDSGWRFFAGDESQDYVDDPQNMMLYDVNTIANYDRGVIPYLKEDPPCAFELLPNGEYSSVEMDDESQE